MNTPVLKYFITDDDEDDRLFIMAALRDKGFKGEFTQFKNGQELVQAVRQFRLVKPDMVILDLNMPLKNGYEALREIKELDPEISVLVLTSSQSLEDRQICKGLGCNGYQVKPHSLDEYQNLAGRILNGEAFDA